MRATKLVLKFTYEKLLLKLKLLTLIDVRLVVNFFKYLINKLL